MSYISDCLKQLNTLVENLDKDKVIKIEVIVEPILEEAITDGLRNYDEQTLEEWYDFAGTVEGIIEQFGEIENISLSKNPNSLSEYIDFYGYDKDGNLNNYIIDLRLSDHGQTTNGKIVRRKHVSKLNPNYELVSVVVNGNKFKTYHEAIMYIRKLLAEHLMN